MRTIVQVMVTLCGCTQVFGLDDPAHVMTTTRIDAAADVGDGKLQIAHLSATQQAALQAAADVKWTGTVTIDTSTLSVVPALSSGAAIQSLTQSSGSEVAIISVHSLISTADVRITGTRPLIIYASETLSIEGGTLDIGARGATPGAGARTSGIGVGHAGANASFSDGGGGGGGFGTAGGNGGTGDATPNIGTGGAAGEPVGDVTVSELLGGSSGGNGGSVCSAGSQPVGGAGGGALQLSAPTLVIDGTVNAGGGGGAGGPICASNVAAAGGGGSGGAIYLQSFALGGMGSLIANGGGGGSGGNWNGGPGSVGFAGDDALALTAAVGAMGTVPDGGGGGNGAAMTTAAQGQSVTSPYPNGGGGGGGAGRIYIDVPRGTMIYLATSPAAGSP